MILMSTPLHMDLEAARQAQARMSNAWERMDNAITAYMKAADSLRDGKEWISPSYFEYNRMAGEAGVEARKQIAQLEILKDALAREISEWESAGSKLG